MWALPDGDNFYHLAMRLFTTTDYTPDYLHDFGLEEVDRIQSEILGIPETEGWDISQGFHHAISEWAEYRYDENGPAVYFAVMALGVLVCPSSFCSLDCDCS
jgi:uncharacterized protein (DUF885 family)